MLWPAILGLGAQSSLGLLPVSSPNLDRDEDGAYCSDAVCERVQVDLFHVFLFSVENPV